MTRLPQPGSDENKWGDILNDFLNVEHSTDGSLKNVARPQDVAAKADKSTTITAGTGLIGGGDLSASRTLSIVDDTTTQKVEIAKAGSLSGARKRLNFVDGSNVTIIATDDIANNKLDISISAASGAAPAGGTTGEVLAKASNTNGDVTWADVTTIDHTATPLAASGNGSPGVSIRAAAADHVHPAGFGGGLTLGTPIILPRTASASSPPSASGPAKAGGAGPTYAAGANMQLWPMYFDKSATIRLGLSVASTNAGSLTRIALWDSDGNSAGQPGTLLACTAQIGTSGRGAFNDSSTSVSVQAYHTYWVAVIQQGTAAVTSYGTVCMHCIPSDVGGGAYGVNTTLRCTPPATNTLPSSNPSIIVADAVNDVMDGILFYRIA